MSRTKIHRVLTIVAVLSLVLSIAAHATLAKDTKTEFKPITSSVLVTNPVTLAGKQLKPGNYSVTVNETQAKLSLNGKVIAEVPVQWKDERAKAQYTTLVADGDQVKEIHFSGKMKYAEIAQ
jgi:hypothetical protein